jgi:hypothetical protein
VSRSDIGERLETALIVVLILGMYWTGGRRDGN